MDLGEFVLATGALGTAAFGVVETLKILPAIGNAGFPVAQRHLGPLHQALEVAYGGQYLDLLRGQYRAEDRDLLARSLRQGVRVGITDANAGVIAGFLGSIDTAILAAAIKAAESGDSMTAQQRNIIGRYELAADARIDAALTLARARYIDVARITAMVVALTISFAVGLSAPNGDWFTVLVVGLAAVPLAPIAKDVASGIQAATKALRSR